MPKRLWTASEVASLWSYADSGFSLKGTAKQLGRTLPSVAIKASKLGISFHGKSGAPKGNRNSAKPHSHRVY
jgi:hypothetical protein